MTDDFIVLSEFAELEGPVPILVVPSTPTGKGHSFGLEDFVVRIQAADWQGRGEEDVFPSSESQVMVQLPGDGAAALVDHVTLFDVNARGYVRPLCLSYVSFEAHKLRDCMLRLRRKLLDVSALLKRGNLYIFLRDLEESVNDYSFTCRYLEKLVRKKLEEENIEGHNKREGHNKKNEDDKSEGHNKKNEDDDKEDEFKDVDLSDGTSDVGPDSDPVSTLSFVKETLDELRILRVNTRKRAMAQVMACRGMLEVCIGRALTQGEVEEAAAAAASDEVAGFGELHPLLVEIVAALGYDGARQKPQIVRTLHKGRSRSRLRQPEELCGTDWYSAAVQAVYGVHRHFSRPTFVLQVEEAENADFFPPSSLLLTGGSVLGNLCLEPVNPDAVLAPAAAYDALATTHGSSSLHDMSTPHNLTVLQVSPSTSASSSREEFASPLASADEANTAPLPLLTEGMASASVMLDHEDAARAALESSSRSAFRPAGLASIGGSSSAASASHHSSVGQLVGRTPGPSSYATLLWARQPQSGAGAGLLDLVRRVRPLKHAVYGLLTGRPLVVRGSADDSVRSAVRALSVFVPETPGLAARTAALRSTPLRVQDLVSTRLVGLARAVHIPASVARLVSILDFDADTLTAPMYHGTVVSDLLARRRMWPAEDVYLAFVHARLLQLAIQASLFYHSCVAASTAAFEGGEPLSGSRRRADAGPQPPALREREREAFLRKFKISAPDARIIEHFSDLVLEQQAHDTAGMAPSFHLDLQPCSTFPLKLASG